MNDEVRVWWRDDDAGYRSERLDGLLQLVRRTRRPVALAVIPARLEPEVAAAILACDDAVVLQHGWDHADHAPDARKQVELGGTLGADACRDRLARGKAVMEQAFGERFLPVQVPPWNRIERPCLPIVDELGFVAVSTFADDSSATDFGLAQVNTHVDLINWQAGRRMKPLADLLAEVDQLLGDPALGTLGVMSHHLDMTPADLDVLEQLFHYLDSRERCRWAHPTQLFEPQRKPTDAITRRGI
jgi:hypothetical protein